MNIPLSDIYSGINVLITGHTGFKGSWLALWLQELGANVIGYSLPPPTSPSLFESCGVAENMIHIEGDILDFSLLKQTVDTYQPEIIFHLAAQSIVLESYNSPKETLETNVTGTLNVLEAARLNSTVKALVLVTTDKCYENHEWIWSYRENDRLGGEDPYSASKAMAELLVASYNSSFYKNHSSQPAAATVRAGNVIGGGDFSPFRILPDCVRSLATKSPILVRNPRSIRPWLNVFDALSGYLCLGGKLLTKGKEFSGAWNFGPLEQRGFDVEAIVEKVIALWGDGDWILSNSIQSGEKGLLKLNWDKAAALLEWKPTLDISHSLEFAVSWFKSFYQLKNAEKLERRQMCVQQLYTYIEAAKINEVGWSKNYTIFQK